MRKRTLGVVLLAGLAMSGAGAFTGSSTLPSSSSAGYGTVGATGVTVSDVDYSLDTTDSSKIDIVTFTTVTNVVTGFTMKMTLRNASDAVVGSADCSASAETLLGVATGNYLIACDLGTTVKLSDFSSVGLTVVESA